MAAGGGLSQQLQKRPQEEATAQARPFRGTLIGLRTLIVTSISRWETSTSSLRHSGQRGSDKAQYKQEAISRKS